MLYYNKTDSKIKATPSSFNGAFQLRIGTDAQQEAKLLACGFFGGDNTRIPVRPQPTCDPATQKIVQTIGETEVTYQAIDLTPQEIADRQAELDAMEAATEAARMAAKPQRIAAVKKERNGHHAKINPEGTEGIYDANIEAANLIIDGAGTTSMKQLSDVSATQFATDAGSKVGMDPVTWANYIRVENHREGHRAKKIEELYLEAVTAITAAATGDEIDTAVSNFQTKAAAAMLAQTIAEIEAI